MRDSVSHQESERRSRARYRALAAPLAIRDATARALVFCRENFGPTDYLSQLGPSALVVSSKYSRQRLYSRCQWSTG